MDSLMEIAHNEGVPVEFFALPAPLQGIYICEANMPPIIGLDHSLKQDKPALRCVLAKELGHHFTTVGFHIPREFLTYSQRLQISKIEYKAMRWAANYLIPEDDLLDVIASGLYEPWEIAEHFNVTDEFAMFRLRLFGARN